MPITSCLWQQSERHIYPPLGRICVTDVLVGVFDCVCVGGSGSLYSMCEPVKGMRFLRQCCFYLSEEKTKRNPHYACPACKFFFCSRRCMCRRCWEGRMWHAVIVCENCLISLMSASDPPPHPQSNQTTII